MVIKQNEVAFSPCSLKTDYEKNRHGKYGKKGIEHESKNEDGIGKGSDKGGENGNDIMDIINVTLYSDKFVLKGDPLTATILYIRTFVLNDLWSHFEHPDRSNH